MTFFLQICWQLNTRTKLLKSLQSHIIHTKNSFPWNYCNIAKIRKVSSLQYHGLNIATVNWCFSVCLMVFKVTFNNISVISWRSVLLVEEIGGSGENHRPVARHWQTLSHNVVHLALIEIETHNINRDRHTDCIGRCKSNYHTIMTTTAPNCKLILNMLHQWLLLCTFHVIMQTYVQSLQVQSVDFHLYLYC
jgi:hypothetical protein